MERYTLTIQNTLSACMMMVVIGMVYTGESYAMSKSTLWRQSLEQAQQSFADGRHSLALNQMKKICDEIIDTYGPVHLDLADTYSEVAEYFERAGRDSQAEIYYSRAYKIRRELLHPSDDRIVHALIDLGAYWMRHQQWSKAYRYWNEATLTLEEVYGSESIEISLPLGKIAEIHKERGEYKKALELFERTLQILTKNYGLHHYGTAAVLSHMGGIHQAEKDFKRAENKYKAVLTVLSHTPDRDPVIEAIAWNNYGFALAAQNKEGEAKDSYIRALEILLANDMTEAPEHEMIKENLRVLWGKPSLS